MERFDEPDEQSDLQQPVEAAPVRGEPITIGGEAEDDALAAQDQTGPDIDTSIIGAEDDEPAGADEDATPEAPPEVDTVHHLAAVATPHPVNLDEVVTDPSETPEDTGTRGVARVMRKYVELATDRAAEEPAADDAHYETGDPAERGEMVATEAAGDDGVIDSIEASPVPAATPPEAASTETVPGAGATAEDASNTSEEGPIMPIVPPANHPYMQDLYSRSGLAADAPAEEVMAAVQAKWNAAEGVGQRVEAAELLLGRRIDGYETNTLPFAFTAHIFEGGPFEDFLGAASWLINTERSSRETDP